MYYLIGCGGVGSHVLPDLARIAKSYEICPIDGDILEEKNLDRQVFPESNVGLNKAFALSQIYKTFHEPIYFSSTMLSNLASNDVLLCCADNHACRKEVLTACDQYGCRACIAANEYTDAEAYWYEPEWKDTPNDPRLFYPAILTDHSNDPLGPPGCVEMSRTNRQLVLANAMAANFMMWLLWFHEKERKNEDRVFWPVMHRASIFRTKTILFGDRHASTLQES